MTHDNYKILLVEDDHIDQMAFTRFLNKHTPSYTCNIAESIEKAYKLISTEVFDIIITDYHLGDGTALDIIRSIKNIPIVVLSSAHNEKIAIEMIKMGVKRYMVKDTKGSYLKSMPATIQAAIHNH
ncbi:MAG: response regulator [bacterium]